MHLKQSVNNAHKKSTAANEKPTTRKSRPTFPTTSTTTAATRASLVDSSFHVAIWPVLAVAQCFGMMPIIGVRCRRGSTGTLRFRWCSVRVAWTLLYLVGGVLLMALYLKRLSETGVTAKNIGGGIYTANCVLNTWYFFRLASKWPAFIAKWTLIERPFLHAPYCRIGRWPLRTRIRTVAMCFFVLTFGDYFIYSMQTVFNYMRKLEQCNWSDAKHLQRFFTLENLYIFERLPFSVPAAILKTLFDIINIASASYCNLFVMMASMGLATRFGQISQRLRFIADRAIPESTWAEVRIHYVQLCELLDTVNDTLAPFILMSCANNLYFICFQLLNIFDELDHLVNYLYYWYSLLYLIARTAGVFICASAIHDAAWTPMLVIRSVPSALWCTEVERFCSQINGERPGLSGAKFFWLTRNNLLTMFGTIITYELVLMQFAESTKATDEQIDAAVSSCAAWVDVDVIPTTL